MIKFFNLFFLIVINLNFCLGLDKSPEIKRVCLDYNTSTATIYWEKINDACNSFNKFNIYSSENEGSWTKIAEINDKNITEFSYVVSNLSSTWKFKIVSYLGCNNIDSFISNSVYIDKTPPNNIEIDSVSFDFNTQNIIIGWTPNSSKDTKGYKIYKYNNSVNDFISYSYIPFLSLTSYNETNPEYFSLASFDSCNLYSLISPIQKASYLKSQYDSCKKTIKLFWSNYEGWSSTKSYIVVNRNNNGFKELIDVTGINNYEFKHLQTDDKLCFYIRTINQINKFTSSSNMVCINTRKDIIPSYTYISNVTVEEKIKLKISFEIENNSTIDSFLIFKSALSNNFKNILNYKTIKNQAHYEFWDENVDINNFSYQYIIKCINVCKDTLTVSNIGKSILLTKYHLKNNEFLFNWNQYKSWQNGISAQEIQISYNNQLWFPMSLSNLLYYNINLNNLTEEFDSVCFRIINKENKSSYNTENSSISNEICIKKTGNYYFPKTINPTSNNNIFKAYGNNLNISKSELEIYNRWGEKIYYSEDILKGWNFMINEKPVDLGTYIFKVKIIDSNNDIKIYSGTILVIY